MPDGSRTHETAALAEDARTFATTLEQTHPDPYSGHGGRVEFHRNLEELVREIPGDGETAAAFARRLQAFAARVRDGHTKVHVPDGASEAVDGRLPLDLRVVGEALYVDAVYDDDHADLLAGRVRTVEGVAVPELRERMALAQSSDNAYGDRFKLAQALGPDPASLAALVDTTTPSVTVETTAGELVERDLSLVEVDDPVTELDRTTDPPETNGEPAYRLLDGGDAALLTLPDCASHREVLEFAVRVGGDVADHYDLAATYRRLVGEPVPGDDQAALAALPAATEVFADLAGAMADAGTETLVVDTRGNTGGSSLAAYALTWVLHGRDGVARAAGDQYSVAKDSPLYREQYGGTDRVEATENPAGFDFSSYFRPPAEKGEAVFEELADVSPTFAEAVDAGQHAGAYCPEDVLVVTDAHTFSAGVEPGVLLSKLGARVVGVPSAQAANGPRDVLSDSLPNTGLDVQVSYRYHVFQPGEDGVVFEPDVPLTPERFEAMGRPADAGVRLALGAAGE